MSSIIPVMKPSLPGIDKLSPIFENIEKSGIYSNYGPVLESLKTHYAEYLAVDREKIVPLANATLAIQGALEILGQNNWILPDYTFAATAHAAIAAKKDILIADVRLDNFQLKIPESIKASEYGALPVMPFGAEINFKDWIDFESLVIDAAASLGSPPPNFSEMPSNSMVVYSLHATKVLGAGEGALVICENVALARKLRAWSNFGFESSRVSTTSGTNAKLSEVSSAVALASIMDVANEEREWLARLQQISNLQIPKRFKSIVDKYPGFRPYWIINVENLDERNNLSAFLLENGVETRSWWSARLSDMPAFTNLNKLEETSNSLHLVNTHLGLPIWRNISRESLSRIGNLLNDFLV